MFGIEISYCLCSVAIEQNFNICLLCLQKHVTMSFATWTWDSHKRKVSFEVESRSKKLFQGTVLGLQGNPRSPTFLSCEKTSLTTRNFCIQGPVRVVSPSKSESCLSFGELNLLITCLCSSPCWKSRRDEDGHCGRVSQHLVLWKVRTSLRTPHHVGPCRGDYRDTLALCLHPVMLLVCLGLWWSFLEQARMPFASKEPSFVVWPSALLFILYP